jgi:hypothetical protein
METFNPMRAYGKRFAQRFARKQARNQIETRDAVLWSVDTNGEYCYVKIQGSDELIKAHFPRNVTNKPSWLKLGNAVRVIHRSGSRGYVEVTGPGRAVPTAVEGSSNTPDLGTPTDMVISGMTLYASEPARMGVYIDSGVYRIDGTQYYYLANSELLTMTATDPLVMGALIGGEAMIMGAGTEFHAIDTAPSLGYFRYDAFCIGVDGVIDYVKGATGSQWQEPTKPSMPAEHIQVGPYILIWGEDTVITDDRINAVFRERVTARIIIWCDTDYNVGWESTKQLKVEILDQYGARYSKTRTIKFELHTGTGGIGSSSQTLYTVQTSLSYFTLTYYRGTGTEESPVVITAEITSSPDQGITDVAVLILQDILGDPL